ncbi:MAG: hypothetical protein WCR53_02330 [Bacteroidaceae bacterium]
MIIIIRENRRILKIKTSSFVVPFLLPVFLYLWYKVCDAVRFFCDAPCFFCDAVRFFCDALRHQFCNGSCQNDNAFSFSYDD